MHVPCHTSPLQLQANHSFVNSSPTLNLWLTGMGTGRENSTFQRLVWLCQARPILRSTVSSGNLLMWVTFIIWIVPGTVQEMNTQGQKILGPSENSVHHTKHLPQSFLETAEQVILTPWTVTIFSSWGWQSLSALLCSSPLEYCAHPS